MSATLSDNNFERFGAIVRRNGTILMKNLKTDHDSSSVQPNLFIQPGEELLGVFHTHGRLWILDRSSFSAGDIDQLRLCNVPNFVSMVECGNVRFALVLEDIPKAKHFFRTHSLRQMYEAIYSTAMQQSNWYSNWQDATKVGVEQLLGAAGVNGIGFYISDNVNKTSFTKLNP